MKVCAILTITFIAVLFHTGPSSGELLTVETGGKAVVIESESQAKKDALETALRNSVKEALKPIIEEIGSVIPDEAIEEKIYRNPLRYIVTYKILSEGVSGPTQGDNNADADTSQIEEPDTYYVTVDATIDIEELRGVFLSLVPQGEELQTVTIFMLGIEDYGTMEELKKAIEKIEFVKRLVYHSFLKKRFVFEAVISSSTDAFYERISRKISAPFTVTLEDKNIVIRRSDNL